MMVKLAAFLAFRERLDKMVCWNVFLISDFACKKELLEGTVEPTDISLLCINPYSWLSISAQSLFQRNSRMATEKESAAKVDLGLLEEDDEFEEFPADGGYHLDEKDPL